MENGMELPVLLITQGVLFPETRIKVPIRSKNNVAMLDRFVLNRSIASKTLILVAYRIENEKKVFDIGTVAMVEQVTCFTSSTFTQYTLHLVGVSRAKILDYALPVSRVKQIYSSGEVSEEKEKELYQVAAEFERSITGQDSRELTNSLRHLIPERHYDEVADVLAAYVPRVTYERQLEFLATVNVGKRVDEIIDWCKKHLEANPPRSNRSASPPAGIALRTEEGIRTRPFRRIANGPNQATNPLDKLAAKLEAANLPSNVRERIFEDLNRLKSSGGNGQEASMLMNYLEFVADLPWNVTTADSIDIKKARQLLNDSHEGMDTVKRRVLEYMAVRSLRDDGSGKNVAGPILCFAGPPGVGKTSVARAIAQSLGRKFERISLGGIRDEADIRGHRRTYIGAMPGRLLEAVRHAKTRNPVILLDEVDKLFAGISGSPSAALLEVLDPEQNNGFTDHNNRKSIIQDFSTTKFDTIERPHAHICPTSDIIFTVKDDNFTKVLSISHHHFRFVVDGSWYLEDKLSLACDERGDLCHVIHLPVDIRRRHIDRVVKAKKRAKWNMEKGEFTKAISNITSCRRRY